MLLHIWKFRLLLKNLKFQKFKTLLIFLILNKNLKTETILKLWLFRFLVKILKIWNVLEFWIVKCYTDLIRLLVNNEESLSIYLVLIYRQPKETYMLLI